MDYGTINQGGASRREVAENEEERARGIGLLRGSHLHWHSEASLPGGLTPFLPTHFTVTLSTG